jgi:hypothetical protein
MPVVRFFSLFAWLFLFYLKRKKVRPALLPNREETGRTDYLYDNYLAGYYRQNPIRVFVTC